MKNLGIPGKTGRVGRYGNIVITYISLEIEAEYLVLKKQSPQNIHSHFLITSCNGWRWLFNNGSRCIIFNSLHTNNNQRIRSADDNDQRSKCFLLQRCALRKFHVTDSQNMRDQICVIRFK